jgi:DNA-binding protein HU-beta
MPQDRRGRKPDTLGFAVDMVTARITKQDRHGFPRGLGVVAVDAGMRRANSGLLRMRPCVTGTTAGELEMTESAKPKTKGQIVAAIAEKTGLTKKQVDDVLAAQAELAYKEAAAGFSIPGIGKLAVVQRAARLGRNPATGATIEIPAKKTVKFRVAKAAKDAIALAG